MQQKFNNLEQIGKRRRKEAKEEEKTNERCIGILEEKKITENKVSLGTGKCTFTYGTS